MKTIAYLSDIHLEEQFPIDQGVDARKNWLQALADVTARNVDLIVIGGDIGAPESNAWFFETLVTWRDRLHVSLGNHDTYAVAIQHFQQPHESQTALYYSVDEGDYRFIFLDSSSSGIDTTQRDWLQEQLDPAKKTLIFIHHPILPVATEVDKLYPLGGRELLREILLKHAAEVHVFSGHYHMDDEQTEHNIHQVVTPAISYQIKKTLGNIEVSADDFGYRLIRVGKEGVQTERVQLFP